MLQSVGSEHDNHYISSQSNSIEALVASRNDGKRHLLLACDFAPPRDLSFAANIRLSASGSVATIKSTSQPVAEPLYFHF
jgi:hypothetical protein